MTDFQPLQELERLLGQGAAAPAAALPPTSRYAGVPTDTLAGADGTAVVFLTRRFVPPPESLAAAGRYLMTEGDRLDNVAYRLLGDPELYWRLCDANRAADPAELERVGRSVVVPLPPGVPAQKAEA